MTKYAIFAPEILQIGNVLREYYYLFKVLINYEKN